MFFGAVGQVHAPAMEGAAPGCRAPPVATHPRLDLVEAGPCTSPSPSAASLWASVKGTWQFAVYSWQVKRSVVSIAKPHSMHKEATGGYCTYSLINSLFDWHIFKLAHWHIFSAILI